MTTFEMNLYLNESIQWLCIVLMAYAVGKVQLQMERFERHKMAEIWKPQPIEVYKDWVKSITEEASDKLTGWETEFIENIEARLSNNWNLTENQANKLEQIYASKTK